MAFGVKYRLEFEEQKGSPVGMEYIPIKWKVEILEDAYISDVKILKGSGSSPLRIKWEDIDLYNEWIMASSATLNIIADTSIYFSEITTLQENQLRMDIYKDGVLYWQGFITPDTYEEDYSSSQYFDVSITATDGLKKAGDLKWKRSSSLTSLGNNLGYALFDVSYLQLQIIENIDIYEVSMTTGAANSPLAQITMSQALFKDNNVDVWTYEKVLNEICKMFGCIIFQYNGKWHFKRITLNDGGSFTERTLSYLGIYSSNVTGVNYVLNSKAYGSDQFRIQSMLEINAPIKYTTININNAGIDNYVHDGYFHFWLSSTSLARWINSGASILRSQLKRGYACKFTTSSGYIKSIPIKIKETTQMELNFQFKQTSSSAAYYRIIIEDEDRVVKYYWNGVSWQITSANVSYSATSGQENIYIHVRDIISSVPTDGYIYVYFAANSVTSLAQVTLQGTTTIERSDELVTIEGETTDSYRQRYELETNIADRACFAYGQYASTYGNYALIQIRVSFVAIANGDRFNLKISGVTQSYIYRPSPVPGVEFNTITSLVALIKDDYINDEYSVYYTDLGGNVYNLYVYANFRDSDTGVSYNYNYSESDTTGSYTVISTINNTNAAIVSESFEKAMYVNGNEAAYWTDGSITGGLVNILQQNIHNNFGTPYMVHRGTIIDFTKALGACSVFIDSINNANKYFMFIGGTLNCLTGDIEGQWHEINNTLKPVTLELNSRKTDK